MREMPFTGRELEVMDDAQLSVAAQQFDIFARTSPEDKFRPGAGSAEKERNCRNDRRWGERCPGVEAG